MSSAFAEGDLVQLKSGGPIMSVQALGRDRVDCMWFDSQGRLHEKSFGVNSLHKVEQRSDLL